MQIFKNMCDTSVYVQMVFHMQSHGKISFTNSQRWEIMQMMLAQIPFDICSWQALTITYLFIYVYLYFHNESRFKCSLDVIVYSIHIHGESTSLLWSTFLFIWFLKEGNLIQEEPNELWIGLNLFSIKLLEMEMFDWQLPYMIKST